MKKHDKAEKIDKLIRLVWASLESHLDLTHQKSPEGRAFHRKCVNEYAVIIRLLSELY